MKQYVKLLKGKRLASAHGVRRSLELLFDALDGRRASVGFACRRKVSGMWHPSGCVIALGVIRCGGAEVRGLYLGRWRNGSKRPVLKHGPRSLTSMRVFGCKARPRNESECRREQFYCDRGCASDCVRQILRGGFS